MIKSAIEKSHHYYVVFFNQSKNKTALGLAQELFESNSYFDVIHADKIVHIQSEVEGMFSSEGLLDEQRSRKKGFYWYDFYLGKITGTAVFFICYPYNKLSKYLQDNVFTKTALKEEFFKPNIKTALDYFEHRGEKEYSLTEKGNVKIDIIKYSAEILEESNAKRVNLIGVSPINSKIYDVLKNSPYLIFRPSSLKVNCQHPDSGNIEIAFDRIGNYRFWLKNNRSQLTMLSYIYSFFSDIDAFNKSNFINLYTYLEDE